MKLLLDRDQLRDRLAGTLPGAAAQQLMAPAFRDTTAASGDPLPAAVMILLYPQGRETSLVFIRRNEYDGPHSGQVSFPGGAREPGDGSLQQTALRETGEELGVAAPIEVLGQLTALHIPVSNFMVFPYVGWLDRRPLFRPDPGEVRHIIETTLGSLLERRSRETLSMFRNGRWIATPCYRVGPEKIWGATAMILNEFLQLVSRL